MAALVSMRTRRHIRALRLAGIAAVALGLAGTVAACGSSGGGSASGGGSTVPGGSSAKKLSLSTVTFLGNPSGIGADLWIAKSLGYFQQEGLTVNFQLPLNVSSQTNIAAFMSGSVDFLNTTASFILEADQSAGGTGATIIEQIQNGLVYQLALQKSVATQVNLPTASTDADDVMTQLKAFQGHKNITLGLAGTQADVNNIILYDAFKQLGLTEGVNDTNATFNVKLYPTLSTLTAAFKAGQVDAIDAFQPYTSPGPNPVINIGYLPSNQFADQGLATSPAMIKDHPDTVQAFINAVVRGWQYTKTHVAQTEAMLNKLDAYNGYSDPSIDSVLNKGLLSTEPNPLFDQDTFNRTLAIANQGLVASDSKPLTVTYAQTVNPSFVQKALKQFNITVPNPNV